MTQILDANRTKVSSQIKQHKLVAILRLKQQSDVATLIDCLGPVYLSRLNLQQTVWC
ncbi:hypothetical protein [Pseudoalteromonas sp. S3178]|uniref:hypothetical protein n=1 Tax=Pseudoalteromonas sp. S3178 TaxID=579532 RepID=UPI0020161FBC|nr:hypothetical protein [Pseudoalteromonas sp. S3178]